MRVTWYLFGIFIFTLGEINLASTIGITLAEDAAVVAAPAAISPGIERWKRHVALDGKHKKSVDLKVKKDEFLKVLEKKKEAFKIGQQKKKAAFKDIVQKKKAVILEKKKKIVSSISAKWAKIRAAIKQKYLIMKKKLKKPDVIYDRILNAFREALLEHLESTCDGIKAKLRHKREIATIKQPAANTTANSARPSGPVSPYARTQPQQQRRQLKPGSVSSAGANSNSKSQTTTNVIIDTKPKKSTIKDYKTLLKQTFEIIREVMRTKVILSLVDGAKAEFISMKDKCIRALNNQNQN